MKKLYFVVDSIDCLIFMTAATVKKLVSQLAHDSDQTAYKKLFLYFHPRLLSFSYAITHCRESSEEVVSDVFLNIWRNRATLEQIDNFSLYLYVSTKNISLNYLARQKRTQLLFLDEVKTEFTSLYYNPEQMMITAEMFKRIHAAIQSLPPRCQLIFKLIKEDGLSYKEVAELLQLSVKTIENQMTIALRKLGESVSFKRHTSLS